ncbi:MAG: nucleotidyltransferase family protein [Acidobacteriota bacterium]
MPSVYPGAPAPYDSWGGYHRQVVRAIVLAAGASSRMGRPKAALPLTGDRDTFLARIINNLASAGLTDIRVVTGSAAGLVQAASDPEGPPVTFVHNAAWPTGQLSSLVAGLRQTDAEAATVGAALVTLVDVPLTSPSTIARVLETWRRTQARIVRPSRGNEHGHPVIFDRSLFDELRAADPRVGAKGVVRAHAHEIINVPVDDDGAFLDVDTLPEYEAVRERLRRAPRG